MSLSILLLCIEYGFAIKQKQQNYKKKLNYLYDVKNTISYVKIYDGDCFAGNIFQF